MANALLQHPGRYVVSDSCPEGFLEFGMWGCGISVEVDVVTGQVYLTGAWEELWHDENTSEWLLMIESVAPSLEDWFERWLEGTYLDALTQEELLTRAEVELPHGADDADAAAVWKGLYWFEPPIEPAEPPDPPSLEDGELSGWD